MPRFLHLADIHLGFDGYGSKERTGDFFRALQDAIERYAIDEQVDFVVIAGDLFEHRNIQPATLNQAQVCLDMLRQEGIPVLAIEGNHDSRPYGTQTSWLRYLADWGLLKLLEPDTDPHTGDVVCSLWDEETRRGGYIDLPCGVRVVGSAWYGTAAGRAITSLAKAVQSLPPAPGVTVMLFHHGLEGQIARYQGALRYNELLPLKEVGVDYLALGHIHKNYARENWIFNPGSLEANTIEEGEYDRGVYLVDITPDGIQAELKRDYFQRPMVRLKLVAKGHETPEQLEQSAILQVQQAIDHGRLDPAQHPIVELRIQGQVAFERFEVDTRALQQQLKALSGALVLLLKYDVENVEYASPLSEAATRSQIEQEIFLDLLTANITYRKRATEIAQGLLDLKDLHLQGREDPDLYHHIQNLLASPADN